jgi:methyltransferase (TIGR00027 family)
MRLPDLSSSMYVAWLRHMQSIHEPLERRNPDNLVRHLLPLVLRLRTRWLGRKELSRLRAEPFYYYLLARTKYYDQVVNDAVLDGARRIVIVGCGSDTRAYRFQHLLRSKGIKVLECDQPEAIHAKERLSKRWKPSDYVEYLPIDLNDRAWPELARWLEQSPVGKTLVVMEGVSPYVDEDSIREFFLFIVAKLSRGSQVAYDFKLRGVNDALGRVGRTQKPFRLPHAIDEVTAFHLGCGLQLTGMEQSTELCFRLLPDQAEYGWSVFGEDALVRLERRRA